MQGKLKNTKFSVFCLSCDKTFNPKLFIKKQQQLNSH